MEGSPNPIGNHNPKVAILASMERQGAKFKWVWIEQFQRYLKIP